VTLIIPVRKIFKSFIIIFLLVLYALISLAISALPVKRLRKRTYLIDNTSFFARLGLRVLGVHVSARRMNRKRFRPRPKNYLIIANHLTYVDILVIAAFLPSIFITSVELKRTFPLGLFAWCGGSIFVERRSPAGLKREIGEIERVLAQGASVALFPEGTTSNGDTVRPFKNSLFTAAIATGANLLPVCIRYTKINGHRVDPNNRDSIFYYGGTTFFEHLPRLLSLRRIDAECVMLRPLTTHQNHSRKDLALRAHQMINTVYHERPSGRHRTAGAVQGTSDAHG
jgi:1-acyl-sn-glycerol-3-phosphate acyltransferase